VNKILPAVIAWAALVMPTAAANMPVKAPIKSPAPAPSRGFSWGGCYLGGNGGYGWGDGGANLVVPGDAGSAFFYGSGIAAGGLPAAIPFSEHGFLAGDQIGCNYQLYPAIVAGIEADFDGGNVGGSSFSTSNAPTLTPGAFLASSTLHWLSTVRGRLGWTPYDNWLVYATGGVAFGSVRNTYNLAFPVVGDFFASSQTDSRTGAVWGAGLEWAFYRNWSLQAEFLHYNLGTATDLLTPGGRDIAFIAAGAFALASNNFPLSGNIFRLGLNYKFLWW
jgi:outer membrane immunogenic protein